MNDICSRHGRGVRRKDRGREVGTVAGAGVADGIISWHGGRVGPPGSAVGIVVGISIGKAVATVQEQGEDAK